MAPVNRPNRIGVEGVTRQWSCREVKAVTAAAQAQAKADGTNLSAIVRREMRGYLEYKGWNVDRLVDGDQDTIDRQWVRLLGRKAPVDEPTRVSPGPIDPGGTLELF